MPIFRTILSALSQKKRTIAQTTKTSDFSMTIFQSLQILFPVNAIIYFNQALNDGIRKKKHS